MKPARLEPGSWAMLEFGVEVTTGELVELERAMRGLDTEAARSALTKAHRTPSVLAVEEREAVLSALRLVLGDPTAPESARNGLVRLAAKLEQERETAADEPPPTPTRRTRSTRK